MGRVRGPWRTGNGGRRLEKHAGARFPKIQMRPEIVSASTNDIELLGGGGHG